MPTFAGYLVTPEQQLSWLREYRPELVDADTPATRVSHDMVDWMKELNLMRAFSPTLVMCPQPNPEAIDPDSIEHLGFMFVRLQCPLNKPVWLPPRTGRSQDDLLAGKLLKRYGFPVGEWTVVFQPEEDAGYSIYVPNPQK